MTLDIAEDFAALSPSALTLRLRLNEWLDGDAVQVWWADGELPAPAISYCRLENPNPPGGAFAPPPRWRTIADWSSAVWLSWDLQAAQVTSGKQSVRVALLERNAQVDAPLQLTDVELVVQYEETT